MAFSFGRQFRRIAAEALTADPDEMRALIARILPARDDGAPRVLRLTSESDYQRAPAVIVAAFFFDTITGDEAADLLRKTEDPAFRKPPPPDDAYVRWGPIALDPEWRKQRGLPPCDRTWPMGDYPPWSSPISHHADAPRESEELVNNKENTSAPADGSAADGIREHPPPMIGLQIGAESHAGGYGAEVG
jgi:hypothetical protein